ncbi:COG4223 family protein [Paragemmobacter straminiformis]|uniref:Inner membrane protein n=1 Tax=Paragemmobacter straminiformis TaxID=2045119 RepID=A0A842I8N5_9RHOB|nr:mitofilin family membrane protein [Gemmobacter straminiformis]MBC2836005.1 hypothetical protein [Gemmobacter straminiformis]
MARGKSETPQPDADLMATVEATDPDTPHPAPAPEITAEPAATPVQAPAPKAATPRNAAPATFLALVLGGAVAAGAGFALARLQPGLLAITPPQADSSAELQALKDQIAALPAPDAGLADRLAALESALTQLSDRVAAVESRPAGAADPALAAQVTALQEQVATLSNGAAVPADITAAVEAAEARLKQAEEKANALAAQAEAAAQATRRDAALDRVAAAMDSGAPFAATLADLPDLPPALADHAATGLPSVAALRDAFPAAARDALAAALRANMGESWTDRVSSFLRSQTGLRSLSPREGDDPDAVLSRAEAALSAGDVATALTELAALPEAAKPALADWIAQAQLRLDAEAALASLKKGA